jgi:hypothetical protein
MSDRTRVRRTFRHVVPATADDVFPLLCPVREYEWIPIWRCELIYTESGIAELDCVFKTELGGGEAVWSVSRYEPAAHRIEFVITGRSHVQRLAVQVRDLEGGASELEWTRVYTGLSADGDKVVEELGRKFDEQSEMLADLLTRHLSGEARSGPA